MWNCLGSQITVWFCTWCGFFRLQEKLRGQPKGFFGHKVEKVRHDPALILKGKNFPLGGLKKVV